MVKKILTFLVILFVSFSVRASNYVSTASGYFDDPLTWTNVAGGNGWPFQSNDMWTILGGHTVSYTNYCGNSFGDSVIYSNCYIHGTLDMTQACRIAFGGASGIAGGTGTWTIGRSDLPIDYNTIGYDGTNSPITISLYTSSYAFVMKTNNAIKWYGATRTNLFSFLSESAGIGTNIIHLKSVIDARTGDVICVSKKLQSTGATYHKIKAITNLDIYYDSVTNNNWGWGNDFRTNLIVATNSSWARSADISGVVLVTGNPILVVRGGAVAAGSSFYTYISSGNSYKGYIFQGVRFSGSALLYNNSAGGQNMGHRVLDCTLQWGPNGFYYIRGLDVYKSVFDNNGKGAGGAAIYGCGLSISNCVFVNEATPFQSVANSTIKDCTLFNTYYTLYNCSAVLMTGCSLYSGYFGFASGLGDNSVIAGNTMRDCIDRGFISYAQQGANVVFRNNVLISNNVNYAYFFGGQGTGTKLINNIIDSPTAAEGLIGYYDYPLINDPIVIQTPTSLKVYSTGGNAVSQDSVLSGAVSAYTMQHVIPASGYISSRASVWNEDAIVRPFGVARWSVWLRREDTNVIQLAAITENNGTPFDTPSYSGFLSVVTNAQATGTWYTADLSWNNTNSYSVPVQLWISAYGIYGTNGYSSAVKQNDQVLQVMP